MIATKEILLMVRILFLQFLTSTDKCKSQGLQIWDLSCFQVLVPTSNSNVRSTSFREIVLHVMKNQRTSSIITLSMINSKDIKISPPLSSLTQVSSITSTKISGSVISKCESSTAKKTILANRASKR
jgi:hypothetical protein